MCRKRIWQSRQIYFISDGTHLVMLTTANLPAEEISSLLESLNF